MPVAFTQFQESWHLFLQEAEMARNYKRSLMVAASGGIPYSPLLDRLLPSLLFVRVGALLDEAMDDYISNNGLTQPPKYRHDLNGRLSFLDSLGLMKNAAKCHTFRGKRNRLAHEASEICTWKELDDFISAAHEELQHLSIVGSRPVFEFFGERTPVEPTDPDIRLSFQYKYGLKHAGAVTYQVSWVTNHYGIGIVPKTPEERHSPDGTLPS